MFLSADICTDRIKRLRWKRSFERFVLPSWRAVDTYLHLSQVGVRVMSQNCFGVGSYSWALMVGHSFGFDGTSQLGFGAVSLLGGLVSGSSLGVWCCATI